MAETKKFTVRNKAATLVNVLGKQLMPGVPGSEGNSAEFEDTPENRATVAVDSLEIVSDKKSAKKEADKEDSDDQQVSATGASWSGKK